LQYGAITSTGSVTIPAVKHRVFNLLAGVSLVLCVGTVALWVRSCFVTDVVQYLWKTESAGIADQPKVLLCQTVRTLTRDGLIKIYQGGTFSTVDQKIPGIHYASVRRDRADPSWGGRLKPWLGFAYEGPFPGSSSSNHTLQLPLWVIVFVTAIAPARWYWKKRTYSIGHCHFCGYDLRATPHRCPECGKTPTIP
jgi:hypothetical protein